MFDALLGGQVEPIYYDSLEHPDKYEAEVRDLLEQLAYRTRRIGADEAELLERAVLTFLEAPRPKTKGPPEAAPVKAGQVVGPVEPTARAAPDVPVDASAFWWLSPSSGRRP